MAYIIVEIFFPKNQKLTSKIKISKKEFSGLELKHYVIDILVNSNYQIDNNPEKWHLLDSFGRAISLNDCEEIRNIEPLSTFKLIPRLLGGKSI